MGRAVPLDDLPDNIVPADDLPPPAKQPRVIRSLGEKLPNEREGVDFVFDKPAPKASTQQPSAAKLLIGGADAALSAARNVPFDMAASAGRLLGMPKVEGFAKDQRGVPFTQAGQDIAGEVGQGAGEALHPWIEGGGRALDATGIPNLRGDVGKLLGTANDVLNVAGGGSALLGGVRSRVANTAAREGLAAGEQVRNAGSVAPVAKAAGFDVTPSTVAGTRSVKPSGYAGMMEGDARNPEASLRNAQNMNQRLGEELAIPVGADGRLEPGAFDTARLPAFGVYDEAKRFPGANNPEYGDAVLRAIQKVDVPTEAAPEVARLVQKYHSVGDSAQLVEDLKNLRRTASKRREGDTANQVANEALADVQMAIADSLEDELGRRAAAAGDHGFQERLQDARQHLAQLYETERATSGGYVNVKDLAARQQKTGKLTGNLQLGAHMGENMPDVFMHPQDAAPASMGRTPEAWGAKSFLFRTAERLGGGALSRRAMRGYNEGIPVGPNALDEFNIDPVASRGRPSPMGPNSGPQAPPQPEPPFTPWAGPLELQADAPPGYFSNVLGPQQGRNLAPGSEFSLEGQPYGAGPLQAFEGDLLPWEVPTDVPPLQGPRSDFASQLGPVQPRLDEALGAPPGMPPRPRGVTGPRSAQLTDPTLPRGFQFLDDSGQMPPQGPDFGPADEFTGPERLYRGVPHGADPMAPNERGFTTWSNQRPTAEFYGPNVGEMPFDPTSNVHLGTLEDARMMLGLGPDATAQDIAAAAMQKYRGANRTASYDLPPELDGVPREFIGFGQ